MVRHTKFSASRERLNAVMVHRRINKSTSLSPAHPATVAVTHGSFNVIPAPPNEPGGQRYSAGVVAERADTIDPRHDRRICVCI